MVLGYFLQTNGPSWDVPTGRRDGRVSSASDATNLPGFTDSIDVQKQKFADKGLNTQDLVTLVGIRLQLQHYIFIKFIAVILQTIVPNSWKKA